MDAEQPLNTSASPADSSHTGQLYARMDFETRSKSNLKKVGAFRYAQDKSTSILCLAYQLPGEEMALWNPEMVPPSGLIQYARNGGIIEAHNAEFEYCIWNYVAIFHWRAGLPLLPSQMRCSAAKAAALSLPRSLEDLANALDLPVKKDMDGRRLMLKMSKPRKPTKKNSAVWYLPTKEDKEKLYGYCINDVLTEAAASKILPPLSPKEQKLWELTLEINQRGISCDVELCHTAVEFAKKCEAELTDELMQVTDSFIVSAKQCQKLLDYFAKNGVEMGDVQARTVEDKLKEPTLPQNPRRVLEIRQALAKSSITKYQAMINMSGVDWKIRGTQLYHGATTGRFTGRGIQPQNYARPILRDVENIYSALEFGDYEFFKFLFGDVFTALSSGIRGMLTATPGNDLISGDFSAIEARVILWLAGDEANLKVYRDGGDPYKLMAADIYGVDFSEVTKPQRELGKRAVLGCGFGMGWDKFKKTCKAHAGLEISDALAQKAVYAYRDRYVMVQNFWYDLERAAMNAVKHPGKLIKFRKLQFLYKGRFLQVQLPSGRRLSYYRPGIREELTAWGYREQLAFLSINPKTRRLEREVTYGGKLAENFTQAVARDCMTDAVFRLEKNGYPVILTVHDEIICDIPKSFGSLDEFQSIMAATEDWSKGIPIKVEAWRGERYRK